MIYFGMNKTIAELIEMATPYLTPPQTPQIVRFVYNMKPRLGVDMGDDERPGTNNLMVLTADGIRAFTKTKMEDIQYENEPMSV
jgi:hypothetical protein